MSEFESSVLRELAWRGRVEQLTHAQLDQLLASETVVLYCGFDPTADSLHVGNLVPMMGLAFFLRHGHRPLAIIGGATGRIGDPSGKSTERNLLGEEEIEANLVGIGHQLRTILDRAKTIHPETLGPRAREAEDWQIPLLNNHHWMKEWTYLDFLRDVGKYYRVNAMVAKDSVRTRLEQREQGLSYTEFSYMLIQGFDFLHLREHHACTVQIGGSDQWGNITAGTELIRRKLGVPAFGVTMPLLLSSSGHKFGKSVGGAVWLDPARTSPYAFYQYWINREDADLEMLFKSFTFLAREEIEALVADVLEGRNHGQVQARLAWEITQLVHGTEEADLAVRASRMLFGEPVEGLDDSSLRSIFAEVPSAEIAKGELVDGVGILELMVQTKLQPSKGAARRLVQQGGGYVNNVRVDMKKVVTLDDLASPSMLVLRAGKKKYLLLKVV